MLHNVQQPPRRPRHTFLACAGISRDEVRVPPSLHRLIPSPHKHATTEPSLKRHAWSALQTNTLISLNKAIKHTRKSSRSSAFLNGHESGKSKIYSSTSDFFFSTINTAAETNSLHCVLSSPIVRKHSDQSKSSKKKSANKSTPLT